MILLFLRKRSLLRSEHFYCGYDSLLFNVGSQVGLRSISSSSTVLSFKCEKRAKRRLKKLAEKRQRLWDRTDERIPEEWVDVPMRIKPQPHKWLVRFGEKVINRRRKKGPPRLVGDTQNLDQLLRVMDQGPQVESTLVVAAMKHVLTLEEQEFLGRSEVLNTLLNLKKTELDKLKIEQLCEVFWAFAKVGKAPTAELLKSLYQRLEQVIPKLEPSETRTMVWALAKIQQQPTRILGLLKDRAIEQFPEFTAHDFMLVLWGFSKNLYFDEELYTQIAAALKEKINDMRSTEIGNSLWAFGNIEFHPIEYFEAAAEYVLQDGKISEFNPESMSNVVWGFARVKHRHFALLQAISQYYSKHRLDDFSSVQLTKTLWGLTQLGHKNEVFVYKIGSNAFMKIDEFTTPNLLILADCFATLRLNDQNVCKGCAKEFVARFDEFTAEQLVQLLVSIQTIGGIDSETSRTKFSKAVVNFVYRRAHEIPPASIPTFLKNLNNMEKIDKDFYLHVTAQLNYQWSQLNIAELISLFQTAADIDMKNQERLDRISAEIARKVTDLEPQDFGVLVSAMQKLNYKNNALMESLMEQFQMKANQLENSEYIDLLSTFVGAGTSQVRLIKALEKRMNTIEQFESLDNQQIASIMYILGISNYFSNELLNFSIQMLSKQKLPQITGINSVKVLYTLAHLDFRNEMSDVLVPILRNQAVNEIQNMNVGQLIQFMWSLSVLELFKIEDGWEGILKRFVSFDFEPVDSEALLLYQMNVIAKSTGTSLFSLEGLSDDGRIRIAEIGKKFEMSSVDSKFKSNVQEALKEAGIFSKDGSTSERGVMIDLEVDPKIAVFLTNPKMFSTAEKDPQLLGWYQTKQILLKNEGWKVLTISTEQWQEWGDNDTRKQFLQQQIEKVKEQQ